MEGTHFSLYLLLNTAKTPIRYLYKINVRRLKGAEKKADQLGTLGPEEWDAVVSLLFYCCDLS